MTPDEEQAEPDPHQYVGLPRHRDRPHSTGALVVAGFHRSGTSLFTELLHTSGLFVGDDLLGAQPSNPYGHFEDREVMRIHDVILRDNGLSWQVDRGFLPFIGRVRWATMRRFVDKRRSNFTLWGFKDPRVCFFLPAWRHLIPEMSTVIVYREPAACIASLHRRQLSDIVHHRGPEGQHRRFWSEPDHGLKMWIAHNRSLLAYADGNPQSTIVISFAALRDGFPVVDQINDRWNLGLRSTPTTAIFDPSVATGASPLRLFDQQLLDDVDDILDRFEALDISRQPTMDPTV